MKCTQCFINECDRKHSNRYFCVGESEGIKCTCVCQVSSKDANLASAASIGIGVAVIAGKFSKSYFLNTFKFLNIPAGVGLTALTGGALAIVAGASVVCAGSSMILSPIKKRIIGEHLTQKDLKQEFIFGAAIGALATPIGLAGTLATKSVSDVVRLRIKNRELRKNAKKSEKIEGLSFRQLNEEFTIQEDKNSESLEEFP